MAYSLERFQQALQEKFAPTIHAVPMVAYRERGTQVVMEAEFATALDAAIFVDRHRAHAKKNARGEIVTKNVMWKGCPFVEVVLDKNSPWDWFVMYHEWRKTDNTQAHKIGKVAPAVEPAPQQQEQKGVTNLGQLLRRAIDEGIVQRAQVNG